MVDHNIHPGRKYAQEEKGRERAERQKIYVYINFVRTFPQLRRKGKLISADP